MLALVASGCTSDEAPTPTNAIAPGILSGVVTDAALIPLANANVSVEGMNASALTDATGAFRLELLPGEYVVLASHPDHKTGALRASVLSDQTATLAFQLDAVRRIVPRVEVAEAEGYLACTALLLASGERHALACGQNDPNERASVQFGVTSIDGLEAAVLELVWDARTDAARWLRVDATLVRGDESVGLGGVEGVSPLRLAIPGRLLDAGTLVVRASPTGSFTDEEAGVDAGLVLQQGFTVYASLFYHAPPAAGYTALQGEA
ncbi:MAG TPA: carboxypeptidase-like regulatory domain-containing protein [Candidatus Thermoplasmatota archaeon]|nr:carboxypeptidase-like regulatory domain-containing protein [Candidatus Thermoplasmatota archaeon]